MGSLILYHGTVYRFNYVDLRYAKDEKDFGRGFYTTSSIKQATDLAVTQFRRLHYKPNIVPRVYSFCLDRGLLRSLKMHRFEGANEAWLNYVLSNRLNGGVVDDYDIVIGPVADASAQLEIEKYVNGETLTKKELIRNLKVWRLTDQYCFKSPRAIDVLNRFGNIRHQEVGYGRR